MKYKYLGVSLLFLIVLSCKSKKADLEKFESILGPQKSKVLTELTEEFEKKYLAKKYPHSTLPESYLKFLEEMAKRNFPKREEIISKENEKKYRESGLMDEKYLFPDSVWIEEHRITSRWTYKNEMGGIESYESFRPVTSKDKAVVDSLLELEKSVVDFNSYGSYIKALEKVRDESPFIDLYYTYVTKVGLVGSSLLFPEIRDNNIDISGPVERRVIVLHCVY